MKHTNLVERILDAFICAVLIAAMALNFTACGGGQTPSNDSGATSSATAADDTADDSSDAEAKVSFSFKVVDADGNETPFTIETSEKTVGAALLSEGLIEGENSEYGLYVKTVNGITADYDVDGSYWAFYINGEYASTGVDSTEITPGAEYMFKVEKQ